MEIQIKSMSLEHATDVQRLSQQLGYSISVPETESNIRNLLNAADHRMLVALDRDKIVGWVHAFKTMTIESLPFNELAGLIVDENYRGKGIGKVLTDQIKQWCIKKGVSSLRVRSNVKRKEAHRFYLLLGFSEIKEQKVFQMNV